MFSHLHTHSYYSFLDGVLSPSQLVSIALAHGMQSLALTDHNGLTGAIEFYDSCIEAGIKPILGLELAVQHPLGSGNLVLLAMDLNGWGNLCELSSQILGAVEHKAYKSINLELLEHHSEKLICLSGGKRGLPYLLLANKQPKDTQIYLGQLKEIFKDRVYIEVQSQVPEDIDIIIQLADLGKRMAMPIVATNNVHYKTNEQMALQRTLSAVRTNTSLDSLPCHMPAPKGSNFTSTIEMTQRFMDFTEAIVNTQAVVEQCNLELPVGVTHFPEIKMHPNENVADRLRKLTERGAIQRYGKITKPIRDRIDHELSVIIESGYATLFLIVQEILEYARNSNVPTSSRGSAASSLVAYCLGITTPDPIALNLYFERFLNPGRSSLPDIDTDLCSKRREIVINHVYEQYGADRVAMVATINRYQPRSSIREVAKVYGLSSKQIEQITKSVPYRGWGPPNRPRRKSHDPFAEAKTRFPHAVYQAIFRDATAILGFPRHLSVHPGGIIISPRPITDLVPTHLASKGIVATQFDLDSIERLGLIKIDLLGTRGLTVLGDVSEKIQGWRKREFPNNLAVLDAIPKEDTATSSLLQTTHTIGCFAIESPGMRATMREIHAKTIVDIMIALALYRPGPITGGLKDTFVRRHLNLETVQHIHPALANLLENTHGVILYQEQVLRIASKLAGLSLVDADLLRRAMSHFDPGERMKTLKKRFIEGALNISGVPIEIGEQIWDLMAAFAGYGFPKAHAASYAQVAWNSAWCKAHYAAEFMAAVLAGHGGYYRQYVYLSEARRLGLTIHPPHINHSLYQFSAIYPNGKPLLYMGLDQVHSLTRRTQERIILGRPFRSLSDFLTRVDPKPKEIENLIKVGAFQGFGKIPDLLAQIKVDRWEYRQPRLFNLETKGDDGEIWSLTQRIRAQEAILGIGVDAHPVELVKNQTRGMGLVDIPLAHEMIGEYVSVVGIRLTTHRYRHSSGRVFYLLELDHPTGVLFVSLSEDDYQKNRNMLTTRKPILIEGQMIYDSHTNLVMLNSRRIKMITV